MGTPPLPPPKTKPSNEDILHTKLKVDVMELDTIPRDREPLISASGTNDLDKSKKGRLQCPQGNKSAWKSMIFIGAVSSTIVFCLNLAIILWAVIHYPAEGSSRISHKGSCDRARKPSTFPHLIINIFSTVLLGASNYCDGFKLILCSNA